MATTSHDVRATLGYYQPKADGSPPDVDDFSIVLGSTDVSLTCLDFLPILERFQISLLRRYQNPNLQYDTFSSFKEKQADRIFDGRWTRKKLLSTTSAGKKACTTSIKTDSNSSIYPVVLATSQMTKLSNPPSTQKLRN